jgi:fructoselysine-6-P-deglycase FrlB-like protein
MNSLESLEYDFNSQISQLSKLNNEKIFEECIFVGSGDSYVAGLIAEYLTNHKCRCYSPSDLSNLTFLKNMTYCFISVTGKTRANIELAKLATKSGIKSIAVTQNQNSQLAKICHKVVPLKITKVKTPTAGFNSFVANVVTCLQLAGITIPKNFDTWHRNALELSQSLLESIMLPKKDPIYLLGNNLLYALSQYASLKLTEFFGATTIAHKLEEFCHSPIFGTRKSHHIWVLGNKEKSVAGSLEKLGTNISYFEFHESDIIAELFKSIFLLQNMMLLLAKRHGLTELQFLVSKDKLQISSELIYDRVK